MNVLEWIVGLVMGAVAGSFFKKLLCRGALVVYAHPTETQRSEGSNIPLLVLTRFGRVAGWVLRLFGYIGITIQFDPDSRNGALGWRGLGGTERGCATINVTPTAGLNVLMCLFGFTHVENKTYRYYCIHRGCLSQAHHSLYPIDLA